MVFNASDLRIKNFNFFLIIIGVVMTAYINIGKENARLGLGAVGVLVSLSFLVLDLRGRELLDAAYKELTLRELALGISIRDAILEGRKGKLIKKAISHTFVYRTIYLLGVVLSFILTIFALGRAG
jgi:hypothetical protein